MQLRQSLEQLLAFELEKNLIFVYDARHYGHTATIVRNSTPTNIYATAFLVNQRG